MPFTPKKERFTVSTTIADLLDADKVAQLMELAAQAEPIEWIDTQCTYCKASMKHRLPIVGTVVCVDCANALAEGKSGRRYLKRPKVDLSNYTDAELGHMVRQFLLEHRLPSEQETKVEGLMEVLGWSREKAVAFITKETA